MPLTVGQLRSFDSNWGNLVVQQDANGAQQVKAGGFRHALASLFHTDAAQARNKATYTAIRNAIMQDDRFFAPDVKAKADELLKGLDNGSGISASTIKGIIRQLDEMSTPEKQQEAVRKAAIGHLAALGVPGNVPASVQAKYNELAADFVAFRSDPKTSMASIKVDQRVAEFNRFMHGLFRSVGDDAEAKEVFCATLNNCAMGDGGTVSLSPADRLQEFADMVKDNLQELDEIGNSRGDAVRQSFSAMLKRTGGISPGALTALADKGAALPKCGIDYLDGQSGAGAIHGAISKMADAMDKARGELSGSLMKDLDPDEAGACLAKAAVARLPEGTRRNLLAALRSNGGLNLLGCYAQNAANPKAQRMNVVYSALLAHLDAEFNDTDAGAAVRPPAVNAAALPPEAVFEFATGVDDLLVGAASQRLKNAMIKGSELDKADDPVAELRRRMDVIAKGSVTATIATGMDSLRDGPPTVAKSGPLDFDKNPTDFDADFVREIAFDPHYVTVHMGGGTSVSPQTPKEVRDTLVRFVTGNPNATFEALDNNVEEDVRVKTKVHLIMCCMHQGAGADIGKAFGASFDPKGVKLPFSMGGGRLDTVQQFTVSKDEKGAITVGYSLHFASPNLVLLMAKQGLDGIAMTEDGATLDASMEVTFPAENFDALARADWSQLKTKDVRQTEASDAPGKFASLPDKVEEQFRFKGDVSTSFVLRAETLDIHSY